MNNANYQVECEYWYSNSYTYQFMQKLEQWNVSYCNHFALVKMYVFAYIVNFIFFSFCYKHCTMFYAIKFIELKIELNTDTEYNFDYMFN